jgi:acetoin utilization deacetylase AcuC-like enzyme
MLYFHEQKTTYMYHHIWKKNLENPHIYIIIYERRKLNWQWNPLHTKTPQDSSRKNLTSHEYGYSKLLLAVSQSCVHHLLQETEGSIKKKTPLTPPWWFRVCHQLLGLLLLLAVCGRSIIVCKEEIWPSLHGPSPPLHSGFFLSFLRF